jgi:flagellar biosynthesis GTPase FlhF
VKITRFLALTVAFAPMAVMAGPLDDLLGAALKAATEGGQKQPSPATTQAQSACEGRRLGESASTAHSSLYSVDAAKTPTVEAFCASLRSSASPEMAQCYANCESRYRDEFAQVKADREQRAAAEKAEAERQLAVQQEEERKSAAEAEKQRAAIAASGVSVEKAASMAGDMYQAYRYGGISEMLSMENACWGALAKQKKASETGAASCSVAALAGAFVEATYARQQRRGSAPAYNGDMFRQRLIGNMAKAGIREDRAQRVLELSTAHQGSVLLGLMNAGMR